jgi:hypothetical protein
MSIGTPNDSVSSYERTFGTTVCFRHENAAQAAFFVFMNGPRRGHAVTLFYTLSTKFLHPCVI